MPRFTGFMIQERGEMDQLYSPDAVLQLQPGSCSYPILFQTKESIIDYHTKNKYKDGYKFLPFTTPITMLFRYNNQIYNLIGNVAEMTNTEGVSKGGSWFHSKEESKIKNKITYTKPEIWLGFRNVCKWRLP